jgi:O-succinylbenzoate synthase
MGAAPQAALAQIILPPMSPALQASTLTEILAEAAIAHRQRVVLTGYMDHPLGQAFAAWEAARLELQFPGITGVCGLQTHHLFQDDGFTEELGPWSPAFKAPGGTGLGFDDLLEALPWTRLY